MESASTSKFGLTSSALKTIAILFMLINHACAVWFDFISDEPVWLSTFHWYATRLSFVLFTFMISEGMVYTHSRKKYLLRLGIFALISEIPFDLCFYHTVIDPAHQNVFFTLFFGALCIALLERYKENAFLQLLTFLICCAAVFLLSTDYSFLGVMMTVSFYFTRENRKKQLFITGLIFLLGSYLMYFSMFLENGWAPSAIFQNMERLHHYALLEFHGILSFPLIALYNGQRGKIYPQLFFYAFYPGHLLLLYLACIFFA